MLTVTIYVSVVFIAYAILSQPGELLGGYRKMINISKLPTFVKKGLTCPYCLSGRYSLYVCLFMIIQGHDPGILLAVPLTVIIVYFTTKKI
jgi:hypothetical protein